MKQPQQEETWSEALVRLLKSTKEKERVAQALGCSVRTLNRLIKGDVGHVRGGMDKLRELTKLLPQEHQTPMKDLLSQAFPSLFEVEEVVMEIPNALYDLTLRGMALTPAAIRQDSLYSFLAQNMLKQLDQDRVGVAVQVFLCQPGEDGFVRGLLLASSYGTGIWRLLQYQPRAFVGEGTLPARVVLSRQAELATSAEDALLDQATCIIAYPLLRGEMVAGAMVVSSREVDHFTNTHRLTVVEKYSYLFAMVTDIYYPPTTIAFCPLPSPSVQLELLRRWGKQANDHDTEHC
ncbi:hypothetical protein [Reticulibacter mediterranei]|uniref:hypothetical protein n=1 Tax=Reticulibacter mediterranei TaxID=2778369 RepID=UPI001C6933C5|nr:hypothetical protein [Reticulibacter mediterranei]